MTTTQTKPKMPERVELEEREWDGHCPYMALVDEDGTVVAQEPTLFSAYRAYMEALAHRYNAHKALVEALRDMVDNCLACDGDGIVGNFEHGVTWDEPCPRCTDARALLKAEADHAE